VRDAIDIVDDAWDSLVTSSEIFARLLSMEQCETVKWSVKFAIRAIEISLQNSVDQSLRLAVMHEPLT
jgi:hypothetical protein